MRVAFIGLGIMGSRMAANLVRAGHDLAVWNRTSAVAEAWAAEHRARVAASPADAAAGADAVVTMVVDGPQVEAVLLGPDGAAGGAAAGTLIVDLSTIAPATARSLAAALRDRGLRFVDAPVTGSSPKAEAGTLTIMAGGDPADVAAAQPLFAAMGETVVHVGPAGQGQMCKVIGNSLASANAVALGQALLAAKATGVDLDAFVTAMRGGSGGSTMLELKAGPMREHDYATLFKTAHMLKDVDHCLAAVGAAGVPFPAAAEAREILAGAVGRGFADEDFAAVIEVLEGLAGLRL